MKRCALLSDDPDVDDAVLSAAAAAGVPVDGNCLQAELVLCSARRAEEARALLGRAGELWVVGEDAEAVAVAAMACDAGVIVLPAGNRRLAELFVGHERAPVVAVYSGHGGAGGSTVAAALAEAAARRSVQAALVECDPGGPGIDLLMGVERQVGWRWSTLAGARGELGDLRAHLPSAQGVTLVSLDRVAREIPGAAAVRSVIDALARTHGIVVLDVGRAMGELGEVARAQALGVVVVQARVGAAASACAVVREGDLLVVRRGRGASLEAADVGGVVGLDVAAVLPEDSRVAEAAEQGVTAYTAGRRAWRKAVDGLLDGVLACACG